MPRAREDDLCGLYCPKLLAIALTTSANFFFLLDWGEKIVPWCKMGNGKPLVPCTQCSCCSLWSPTSARACGCSGVPEVTVLAQSSQAVRAASLLALGSLPSLGSGRTAGMQQHPSAAASDPAPPLCLTQGSEHLGEEKNPSTIATHRNKSSTQST